MFAVHVRDWDWTTEYCCFLGLDERNISNGIDHLSNNFSLSLRQTFNIEVVFVYNGIRLQRDRSLLSYLRTGRTGEWKQLKFCPFGRVLFIAESISRTARVLSTVPGNIDASYMYSSSDLFIAYSPPSTWQRESWWYTGLCPPPTLMHYFGFASPRCAVATAADIELLRWLATNISMFNNEFMGRPGRFLLH